MVSLTEQYTPWIHKITRRMHRKFHGFYEYQDLLGTAFLASVAAEKTYDPTIGKFSAYIKPRIQGAITRSVSTITGKQNRTLKRMYSFIDEYITTHGNVPTQGAITKHLGISDTEFKKVAALSAPITIVSPDNIPETELAVESTSFIDSQFAEVSEIIDTLPIDQQKRITKFMEGSDEDKADIKDILVILRDKLQIKDVE